MAKSSGTAAGRTLIIERVFDAPPEMVFEAWTKPEHLVNWFGPNDFTLPFCETDFRVGGRYRFCMRSPEGDEHWVHGEYQIIEPPDRIAFTWNREDTAGNIWNSTVVDLTFAGENGKTRFTLHQRLFDTEADRDDHRGGWFEALDRLNAYVLKEI